MAIKEIVRDNATNIEVLIVILMAAVGVVGGLVDLFHKDGEEKDCEETT